jgi:hypothetical protein
MAKRIRKYEYLITGSTRIIYDPVTGRGRIFIYDPDLNDGNGLQLGYALGTLGHQNVEMMVTKMGDEVLHPWKPRNEATFRKMLKRDHSMALLEDKRRAKAANVPVAAPAALPTKFNAVRVVD